MKIKGLLVVIDLLLGQMRLRYQLGPGMGGADVPNDLPMSITLPRVLHCSNSRASADLLEMNRLNRTICAHLGDQYSTITGIQVPPTPSLPRSGTSQAMRSCPHDKVWVGAYEYSVPARGCTIVVF